jgi:hypothetical protein
MQEIQKGDLPAVDRAAIQSDFSVLGRFLVTRQEADIASFKTPSLRHVLVTAPYFHDGSMETLCLVQNPPDQRQRICLLGYQLLEVEEFEESKLPKRLYLVTLRNERKHRLMQTLSNLDNEFRSANEVIPLGPTRDDQLLAVRWRIADLPAHRSTKCPSGRVRMLEQ